MGRSTSCLKIITCGSDSADRDDLQLPESNGSSDKRGWSFRKKSARHRVLSNTIISETTPSSVNKESPEPANLNFQPPDIPTAPEKNAVIQCTDEKPQLSEKPQLPDKLQLSEKPLSASTDQEVAETIVFTKDENEVDDRVEESVVIVIQAAVRGVLAQKELLKLKNVVKLQAAVRGYLVRQHAIGTLRCVQAIVKMQALVRARRARLSLKSSYVENEVGGKHGKPISMTSEKESSVIKPNGIEKLVGNSFARQLMESTPKTKPIHIKCDSSKRNSAWNWLERWMSVSSVEPTPKPEFITEQLEIEKRENFTSSAQTRVPPEEFCESEDSNSIIKEVALPSESEESLKKSDAFDFKFQVCHPNSPLPGDILEQPQPETSNKSDAEETSITTLNSLPNQTIESEVNSKRVTNSLPHKLELDGEQPDQSKRSMKRGASEQLETEGKKFVYGSRKASNPAFIAAQTKFEGLSSTASLSKSFSSSHQDSGVESNTEISGIDTESRTKELDMAENSVPHNSRVQYVGSECGTELSVTSTLDSPDVFEVGAAELEHEAKVSGEETRNPNSTKELGVEDKDSSMDPVSTSSRLDQPEKLGDVKGESANTIVVADSAQEEMNPEKSVSDVKRELNSEAVGLAYRSSPEASPRSHATVPESQGTPSSQLSVKAKKSRADKSSSSQKRKSLSASKRSPSNPNHDSGAGTSVEQLSKDQKNGKRRNSFGSTKPDSTDQEPRDSSSSSSIPHFMQATESARAKLNANNSPRSSPDVQDRDFIKKRQSLPGANGRQGSPRIQRSKSQAQQGAKGNDSHIVHEKKWQR
ncbi:PREDICTED: protein IQ-DOMAIN 32-like [Populus euphratica]|uniref:Protein IQ-DOMAIN 32-like n=1 Tax=Populus euphratica TaxID=75702 RepID=A0AAJ6TN52_POPEU|nr:PREDICTED: protein IQ-DOMAIN 32-like [Populus euphratica]